eukprot:COSAG01_NODE_6099_length_3850_cov_3.542789_2_plen_63_part_00
MRRDLASNWNIDIAHELEDYLEDLEEIKISFDGSDSTLNFAEGEPYLVYSWKLGSITAALLA